MKWCDLATSLTLTVLYDNNAQRVSLYCEMISKLYNVICFQFLGHFRKSFDQNSVTFQMTNVLHYFFIPNPPCMSTLMYAHALNAQDCAKIVLLQFCLHFLTVFQEAA